MAVTLNNIHRHVAAIVATRNRGEGSLPVDDTDIFGAVQVAMSDVARSLRMKMSDIYLLQKKVAFYLPGSLDTITYSAQAGVDEGPDDNDATFSVSNYTLTVGSYFVINITSTGTPDVFRWAKDGGAWTTGVNITGSPQALSHGVSVTFSSTTGHTLNSTFTGGVALLPSDLIRPITLEERTATPTGAVLVPDNAEYVPLLRQERLAENQSPTAMRQIWFWRNREIEVRARSNGTLMRLFYDAELPAVTMPNDEILLPDIATAVAYRAASILYAPGSPSSDAAYKASMAEIERIVENERAAKQATRQVAG